MSECTPGNKGRDGHPGHYGAQPRLWSQQPQSSDLCSRGNVQIKVSKGHTKVMLGVNGILECGGPPISASLSDT